GEIGSTVGIENERWYPEEKNRDSCFVFWDFGGQSFYHSTHKFFVGEEGIYFIVFNASPLVNNKQKVDTARIFEWIDTLIRDASGLLFYYCSFVYLKFNFVFSL